MTSRAHARTAASPSFGKPANIWLNPTAGVVTLRAKTNRIESLRPLVPEVLRVLSGILYLGCVLRIFFLNLQKPQIEMGIQQCILPFY